MSNQKSIIGQVYNAKNQPALDIEAGTRASLGKRPYKVIKDPYLADYPACLASPFGFPMFLPKKAMFINVLDERTGRTYQSVYEPGNLCNVWSEATAKSGKNRGEEKAKEVPFVERMRQFSEELGECVKKDDKSTVNRGIVFFATESNPETEKSSGAAFVGGSGNDIINSITAACSDNPEIFKLLQAAVAKASFERMIKGGE